MTEQRAPTTIAGNFESLGARPPVDRAIEAINDLAAVRSPTTPACAAQLAGALQVAGTAQTVAGLMVLRMTIRRETVLHRVIADATRVCGHPPEVINHRRHTQVRLVDTSGLVTHAALLLTRHAQPGRDGSHPPPPVNRCDLEAMWRGAFLLAGQITPTPHPTATIRCPDHATAHILAGVAHRLRIPATLCSLRNNRARLTVSDVDDLEALIKLIGPTPLPDKHSSAPIEPGSPRRVVLTKTHATRG